MKLSDPYKVAVNLGVTAADAASTLEQQQMPLLNQQSLTKSSEYERLIELYEHRLAQNSQQESHLMSILNQYFAKSQLKDAENREMRSQLIVTTQKCVEYKRELDDAEKKRADLENKVASLTKLHV